MKTEICGVLVESETNKKFPGKKYQKLWNTAYSTSFAPVKTEHKKFCLFEHFRALLPVSSKSKIERGRRLLLLNVTKIL